MSEEVQGIPVTYTLVEIALPPHKNGRKHTAATWDMSRTDTFKEIQEGLLNHLKYRARYIAIDELVEKGHMEEEAERIVDAAEVAVRYEEGIWYPPEEDEADDEEEEQP